MMEIIGGEVARVDLAKAWEDFNTRVRSDFPDFHSLTSTLFSFVSPKEQETQIDLLQLSLMWTGDLSSEVVEKFRRQRWIKLKKVIPTSLLITAREKLIALATKTNKGKDMSYPVHVPPACMSVMGAGTMTTTPADVDMSDMVHIRCTDEANLATACELTPSRHSAADAAAVEEYWNTIVLTTPNSWNIQMMWAVDPFIRALVLSPRIGDIVCRLLGCDNIRVYHDNCLFRVPSSKRTRWHCDDGPNGYMAMAERDVVTVWYPLQRTPPANGSLVFPVPANPSDRASKPTINAWDVAAIPGCPESEMTEEYDLFVAAALETHGFLPQEGEYELGDISIHYTDCFHCAGPNLTDNVRMIIAVTYFADGCTMRLGGVSKFCPGVNPGELVNSRFNPIVSHCMY